MKPLLKKTVLFLFGGAIHFSFFVFSLAFFLGSNIELKGIYLSIAFNVALFLGIFGLIKKNINNKAFLVGYLTGAVVYSLFWLFILNLAVVEGIK